MEHTQDARWLHGKHSIRALSGAAQRIGEKGFVHSIPRTTEAMDEEGLGCSNTRSDTMDPKECPPHESDVSILHLTQGTPGSG